MASSFDKMKIFGNFFEKMKSFWQFFFTFKCQFSGGSGCKWSGLPADLSAYTHQLAASVLPAFSQCTLQLQTLYTSTSASYSWDTANS